MGQFYVAVYNDLRSHVRDIAFIDHYALIMGGSFDDDATALVPDGLHMLDVTDPTHPVHVSSFPSSAWRTTLANGHLYLAGEEGFQVVTVRS